MANNTPQPILPTSISTEDKPFVFDQYKLLVSSLDNSNLVRETSNPYWITVTGLGLGAISYIKDMINIPLQHKTILLTTIVLIGIILCGAWINYLRSLKHSIEVRNQLLEELEGYFPVKLFTNVFRMSGRNKNKGSLTEHVMLIPSLFLLGYIFFGVSLLFFPEEVALPNH